MPMGKIPNQTFCVMTSVSPLRVRTTPTLLIRSSAPAVFWLTAAFAALLNRVMPPDTMLPRVVSSVFSVHAHRIRVSVGHSSVISQPFCRRM